MEQNSNEFNEFTHNGIKYTVWVKDGANGQQIAYVYKDEDRESAVVGTTFGKMASFKNDIMTWAKKCIEKNYPAEQNSKHTPGENILLEATNGVYKFLSSKGYFASPTDEVRRLENLLIQARCQANEDNLTLVRRQRDELLEENKQLKEINRELVKNAEQLTTVAQKETANLIAWDGAEPLDTAIDELRATIEKASKHINL